MTTTSSMTSALSAAMSAAQSAAATNSSVSTTTSSSASSSSNALASLSSNYSTFLTLLTTQLKNQDPSSPMSSDSFTSELAQFAGVEQQVQTNTNLQTLIDLTQDGQESSNLSLVGETAIATTSELPLQSGAANVSFTTTSAEPIAIAITNSAGTLVKTEELTSAAGSNTWTWDGVDNSGNQLSDGSYNIAIETSDSAGNTTAVPFTVSGKVTGVTSGDGVIYVDMGASQVDMSKVSSFSGTSASSSASSATSSGA